MQKRILSLSLVLVFVVALMSGCTSDTANTSSVTESVVVESTDEGRFFGLDISEELDFGGKTVRVLTTATAQSINTFQIQPENNSMYSSEKAPSVINAAAECTRLVEAELGVEVEEEVIYTSSRYGGAMFAQIQKDAMSGTGDYLFAMPCSIEGSMLSMENLLYDLNGVPNIDLSREWWCQEFNNDVTIDGKCYFAISDIGTVSKEATLFVAFNKKMAESYALAENYGYKSLYEMVDEKAWTQDRMYEMAKTVYQDTNENNICDVGDVNGLAGQDSAIAVMLSGSAENIVEVDKEGYPVLSVYNQRAVSVINDAQEYFKDPQSGFISANDYFNVSKVPVSDVIVPEFKADRLLFLMESIMNLELIRDMESDFGVLPVPLYDDLQENYVSRIGCWSTNCIVIPTYVSEADLELAGYFIEALSAVSRAKLNPVYYEQTLQYQISRDDDSMRMLDIIFAGRSCDLAEIFNLEMYKTVCGMMKKPQGSFASEYESVKNMTQRKLDEIVQKYKSHKK